MSLISYLKLCVYTLFRNEDGNWMFYTGCACQVGSCLGGVLSFILVNIIKVFTSKDPCN